MMKVSKVPGMIQPSLEHLPNPRSLQGGSEHKTLEAALVAALDQRMTSKVALVRRYENLTGKLIQVQPRGCSFFLGSAKG